mmetsp:Transcript_26968/g.58950  ORF Transcript_26968/g.58950 Transcript_26968/m.58950 type:complete len:214 (+) Transcript_26968:143-784(+)|eukprot:CAMPEP_0202903184 /NCGR_PEP_ID=MMETSP1392-20130828/22351_1 /ASSEMBLY_ACC=CAM_ASM_000868 /TAXON_ID=225041 /ORGANISM="Chlamydomonas chlamydogama, Strain SAG 11-48b" /LENGTH=213 /DNA_ID=CAMNT_0049590219 /DNA_START=124 /DNA_END=765 /DNA_ORIENTATION=-
MPQVKVFDPATCSSRGIPITNPELWPVYFTTSKDVDGLKNDISRLGGTKEGKFTLQIFIDEKWIGEDVVADMFNGNLPADATLHVRVQPEPKSPVPPAPAAGWLPEGDLSAVHKALQDSLGWRRVYALCQFMLLWWLWATLRSEGFLSDHCTTSMVSSGCLASFIVSYTWSNSFISSMCGVAEENNVHILFSIIIWAFGAAVRLWRSRKMKAT